jgi:glucosamine--fructose-6-phosphate aminotransferase (isomerizing)
VPIIALCNVEGSTLFREATASILLEAGPEIAVASTKTFTSQLMILFLLALFFCSRKEGRTFDLLRNMQEIEMIPKKIAHILEDHREIQRVAKKYSHFHDVYFLGRGALYPLALEGALKLKEIAYVNAVGYAAGEMKHGPIALLDENVPSVILCGNEELEGKIISNLMESRARHSPILVAGFKNLEKDFVNYCSDALIIPHTTDLLSCILLAVVFQLFAYYIAKEKKLDIDQPKNLAKSVTVE